MFFTPGNQPVDKESIKSKKIGAKMIDESTLEVVTPSMTEFNTETDVVIQVMVSG